MNKREPLPPTGPPKCPRWLNKEAKAMWRSLLPQLKSMGVLTHIDGNALVRYCQMWARWREAEEFIAKFGPTYAIKGEGGKATCFAPFPQVAIAHKLSLALGRLEQEFGLTPSARTRITIDPSFTRTPEERAIRERFFGVRRPTPPSSETSNEGRG